MTVGDAPMTDKTRGRRVEKTLTTLVSLLIHGVLGLALMLGWMQAVPQMVEPPAIQVALVPGPRPNPDPKPAPLAAAKPQPVTPTPARSPVRKAVTYPHPAPLPVSAKPARDFGPGLSDSDIAGASTAESGSGGGGECNMTRMVQLALRKDPVVQNALREMGARAVMVWNGGWMQAQGEDGNGLAAVREAIMWEVAFAPEACRRQTVRGMVLLSVSSGGARLGLGRGEWRWSDVVTRPQNR